MNGTNRYQPMMPGDSGLTGQATQSAEAQLVSYPKQPCRLRPSWYQPGCHSFESR